MEEDHLITTDLTTAFSLEEINREHFSVEQRLDQNIVRILDEIQMQPDSPLHKNFVIDGFLYRRQEDKFVCLMLIVVPVQITKEIKFTVHDSEVNCHL